MGSLLDRASAGMGRHLAKYLTQAADMIEALSAITAAQSAPQSDALAEMEARKDAAYYERNQVVAALSKCFHAGVAKTAIEGWSEDWHGCVYIDLPTGQVSWHFHDSQAHLFAHLPQYQGKWDGHDTPEKYRRLAALPIRSAPQDELGMVRLKVPTWRERVAEVYPAYKYNCDRLPDLLQRQLRDCEIADLREALHQRHANQVSYEMDQVAIMYAHSMALHLECILHEYSGQWYDEAINTLGKYREAMNAIHERESPTFLGEPVISKDKKPPNPIRPRR